MNLCSLLIEGTMVMNPPLLNLFILGFVIKQNNSNKLEGITFLLVAYTTKNKYNRPWLVY